GNRVRSTLLRSILGRRRLSVRLLSRRDVSAKKWPLASRSLRALRHFLRSAANGPGPPHDSARRLKSVEVETEGLALECIGAAADPLDRRAHPPAAAQDLVGERDQPGIGRRRGGEGAQALGDLALVPLRSKRADRDIGAGR